MIFVHSSYYNNCVCVSNCYVNFLMSDILVNKINYDFYTNPPTAHALIVDGK